MPPPTNPNRSSSRGIFSKNFWGNKLTIRHPGNLLAGITAVGCFLLIGCAGPKVIRFTEHTDLSAIPPQPSYDKTKARYSVSATLPFEADSDEQLASLKLAREGVNYEVPPRKIVFEMTLWDLPLIKAFLRSKGLETWSESGQ